MNAISLNAISFSAGRHVRQPGSGIARRSRTHELAAGVMGASLTLLPMSALAQEQELPPAPTELMELLEYLGSWDGPEEDWVQFLGDAADLSSARFDIESGQPTTEALAGVL
jgi:hypothetical protein